MHATYMYVMYMYAMYMYTCMLNHDTEQLRALVHSISLPQENGIDFHSLFVVQTLYLPSKSGLKLTISSWLSRNWKINWNSPGGCNPRLRFTFRCDLARVINLICIVLYCIVVSVPHPIYVYGVTLPYNERKQKFLQLSVPPKFLTDLLTPLRQENDPPASGFKIRGD